MLRMYIHKYLVPYIRAYHLKLLLCNLVSDHWIKATNPKRVMSVIEKVSQVSLTIFAALFWLNELIAAGAAICGHWKVKKAPPLHEISQQQPLVLPLISIYGH